jgi:hypothetical protein
LLDTQHLRAQTVQCLFRIGIDDRMAWACLELVQKQLIELRTGSFDLTDCPRPHVY